MDIRPPDLRLFAPATLRNREAIAAVLEQWLPPQGDILEVASGTGEHAVYLSGEYPKWQWHPSEVHPDLLESIRAWKAQAPHANLHDPVLLDVSQHPWPVTKADAVVAVNLLHIAPLETAAHLMRGANATLNMGGRLLVYGPFFVGGVPTAPSNTAFDESLRQQDPRWGIRAWEMVDAAAQHVGLLHRQTVAMPANNFCSIWQKGQSPARARK